MLSRILLLVGIAALGFDTLDANAASGDTIIKVSYQTKTYRTRPHPGPGGALNSFEFVLHRNGTVNEKYSMEGANPLSKESNRELGRSSRVSLRVVSDIEIERIVDDETSTHRIRITLTGKSCVAEVSGELKPGQTEYRGWTSKYGQDAFFSRVEYHDIRCSIQ